MCTAAFANGRQVPPRPKHKCNTPTKNYAIAPLIHEAQASAAAVFGQSGGPISGEVLLCVFFFYLCSRSTNVRVHLRACRRLLYKTSPAAHSNTASLLLRSFTGSMTGMRPPAARFDHDLTTNHPFAATAATARQHLKHPLARETVLHPCAVPTF